MAKKDYKALAETIIAAVGGKSNVTAAAHCMTRLRLNLGDRTLVREDEVKNISGVLGAQWSGDQYQIIIGQDVPKLYNEFCAQTGLSAQDAINENLDAGSEKMTAKKFFGRIMDYIAGSMTPLIPAMMAAGLCKALSAVLGPNMLNVVGETHNLYILLNMMYDGFFYFLPIFIGFNAAKKMNVPPVLGAYLGGILLVPTFVDMVANGTPFDIFGINVTLVNYSQSMVPVLLSVAFMGFLYRGLAKIMPDVLTTVFTPLLTMLVSVPVSFIALAPLGTIIANAISGGIAAFGHTTGFVGVAVIGATWEFIVMTGMHGPILMAFFAEYFENGFLTGAIMGGNCATWACWGVALGAFLRLKNKQEKSTAGGFFISGIVGGITEPTLYGLCMKYRRCFISLMIGGAVGGVYVGLTHVCQYVLGGASNFLNLIGFTGGSTANLVNGVIGSVLSLVVGAVATYFIGFSKEELKS